jgi:hypothetical protein
LLEFALMLLRLLTEILPQALVPGEDSVALDLRDGQTVAQVGEDAAHDPAAGEASADAGMAGTARAIGAGENEYGPIAGPAQPDAAAILARLAVPLVCGALNALKK